MILLVVLSTPMKVLRHDPNYMGYNLNKNETAAEPTEYWGEWDYHTCHPSQTNWRFPFYVVTTDRYVGGDPSNNEANGTVFEHTWMSNQFRFGRGIKGLYSDLDYIQGMGIKVRRFLELMNTRPC